MERKSIREEHLAGVVIPTRFSGAQVRQALALTVVSYPESANSKSPVESNADSQGRTSLSHIHCIPTKLHSRISREQILQH